MKKMIFIACLVAAISVVDFNVTIPIRGDAQPNCTISMVNDANAQSRRNNQKPRRRGRKSRTVDTSVPVPGSLIVIVSLIGGGGLFIYLRGKLAKRKQKV